MRTELLTIDPAEKLCYSIDDMMELYGLDPWTVRMWVDWFGIPGHISTADGNLLFSPQAVGQIGVIRSLMKKRMKIDEVRKYLESEFGGCEQKGKESVPQSEILRL